MDSKCDRPTKKQSHQKGFKAGQTAVLPIAAFERFCRTMIETAF